MAVFDGLTAGGSSLRSRIIAGVCFLVVFVLFVLDFSGFRQEPVVEIRKGVDGATAEVTGILNRPGRWVRDMGRGISLHFRLKSENERLREENQRLRQLEAQVSDYQERMEHYEDILNADISGSIFAEKIAGRTVSEFEGPFVRSALINVGTIRGVKEGHPVLTHNGLYGRVVRAGPRSSRVLLLTDLNSRIPVMSQTTRNRAMLSGDNSNKPRLTWQTGEEDWQDGDRIVTSGDGGLLPRGLPIGILERQGDDQEPRVKLFTDAEPVDWIWVSPYTPISKPPDAEAAPIVRAGFDDSEEEVPEGDAEELGSDSLNDNPAPNVPNEE